MGAIIGAGAVLTVIGIAICVCESVLSVKYNKRLRAEHKKIKRENAVILEYMQRQKDREMFDRLQIELRQMEKEVG